MSSTGFRTDPATYRWRWAAGLLVTLGFLLILALVWQHVSIYFTFDGDPVVPTHGEITRYVWTASACIVTMVAAVAAAFLSRSRLWGVLSVIGILGALAAALVFAVPQDRWRPDPPTYEPPPAGYEPCYSGSNDCGPGG